MFDPTLPQENTLADAAQMRSQFNGLKALIDALLQVSAAQVDAVNTLPPWAPGEVPVAALSLQVRGALGELQGRCDN
jgi:hypothetical protein